MASQTAGKRSRRWALWLRELAIAAALLVGISLWQGRDLLHAGEPAPDVELTDLDGAPVHLSDLRGHKVLLYFWAPWCSVCKVVTPNLRWLAGSDQVQVVSIASSYEDLASVRAADPESFSDIALLGGEHAANAFSVRAYPTFYLLDEEGRIERSFLGYTSRFGLWWRTRF